MPRPLPQPRRSDLAEEHREIYDYAVSRQNPDAKSGEEYDLDGYHGTILNAPDFARLLEDFGQLIRMRSHAGDSYSAADRITVDHVLSKDLGTNSILYHFVSEGLAFGMRLEAMKAIRYGTEEDLNEDERLVVAYIRAVVRGELTDELWDRMVDRIGPKGAMEYLLFINFLLMTIRNYQGLLGLPEPPDEDIDRLIAEYESGERKPPVAATPGLTGRAWDEYH